MYAFQIVKHLKLNVLDICKLYNLLLNYIWLNSLKKIQLDSDACYSKNKVVHTTHALDFKSIKAGI